MFFRTLIVCFFLFSSSALNGQEADLKTRPKIGVVLSGGGAKGISHIGVLKALERAGIRPDYITGTSMGAVIGGLYAIGYSADTLEKIIQTIDWDQVLSNKIPLNYVAYEEKYYYDRYLINFPIVNFKPTLPNGLIDGQMLSELLSDYTWNSSKYQNFDEFPIPFRCIATDVSTGKPVVFKDGPLVRAMRASMAIPTAFTSVNVDTTLFVDGGIVNNFPVELVREMGADIVIGVNVSSSGFDSAEDINNIPGILMQMAMISSLDKLPEQIAGCDIYIHPKLEGYNTASFSSYDAILKIGDEAGDEYYEEFRELAIKLHLNDTLYRGIPMVPQAKVISEIELIGNKLTPDYVILGKLGIEVGDLVTREMIEEGIRTVFGLNNFFKVSYYLSEFKDENVFKLTLNIEEKPPAMLLASVHYDNTFSAGIILNLTMRNILLKGSRAVIEGDISENPKFRFDYLKYMGRYQHFALEGIYDYNLLQIPVYQNGELVDFGTRSQNIIQVKAITTHSLKYSFGIGYQFLNYTDKSKFSFSLEGVDKTRVNYSSIVLSYFRNSMNNRNFPTEGTSLELIANTVFKAAYSATPKQGVDTIYIKVNFNNEVLRIPVSKEELPQLVNELEPSFFTQFYANFKTFKTFSPSFQMIPNFAAGLVISDQSAGKSYDEFGIGGVQRINLLNTRVYGLNYNELYKPNFGLVGLTFQNVLWKNLFIQYGASALAYYDYVPINDLASIDWQSLFDNNTMIGYGFVVRYKSIIGPISAGVSRNTQDPYFRYYFQIGYSFGYSD